MTWVKICGTTNLEDALLAVDAGADAVGFVFYEKSPRNVSFETVNEIVAKLPKSIEKVGVFVLDEQPDWGLGVTGELTALQMHFPMQTQNRVATKNTKAYGRALFPKLSKYYVAIPAQLLEDMKQVEQFVESFQNTPIRVPTLPNELFDTYLVDSGAGKTPGGTGKTFDWQTAAPAIQQLQQRGVKIVAAGGLTPMNVSDAVNVLKPWGVDVVSGVEARPGKKDPEKVRAFVKAVREMDRKAS